MVGRCALQKRGSAGSEERPFGTACGFLSSTVGEASEKERFFGGVQRVVELISIEVSISKLSERVTSLLTLAQSVVVPSLLQLSQR
jgi:hypothetical protein